MNQMHDASLYGAKLVFCTFNTFFALDTQEKQVRCFRGVSSILAPGGAFLLEVFVPDPTRFGKPQPVLLAGLDDDGLMLEASQHDSLRQRVSSRLVIIKDGAIKMVPIEIRYAWPSELDLMAEVAGLQLSERWAGWDRRAFTAAASGHVSVYKKAAQ